MIGKVKKAPPIENANNRFARVAILWFSSEMERKQTESSQIRLKYIDDENGPRLSLSTPKNTEPKGAARYAKSEEIVFVFILPIPRKIVRLNRKQR